MEPSNSSEASTTSTSNQNAHGQYPPIPGPTISETKPNLHQKTNHPKPNSKPNDPPAKESRPHSSQNTSPVHAPTNTSTSKTSPKPGTGETLAASTISHGTRINTFPHTAAPAGHREPPARLLTESISPETEPGQISPSHPKPSSTAKLEAAATEVTLEESILMPKTTESHNKTARTISPKTQTTSPVHPSKSVQIAPTPKAKNLETKVTAGQPLNTQSGKSPSMGW